MTPRSSASEVPGRSPISPVTHGGYDEAIRMMWNLGLDTAEIARRIGISTGGICPESVVANRLAIIRDAARASQAEARQ